MLIRPATEADIPLMLELIKELAIYEKEPDAAVATAEDLKRDGFGEHPYFHVLIAETEHLGKEGPERVPAGFAFYFFNYSTWQGKPGYCAFFPNHNKRRNPGLHQPFTCVRKSRVSPAGKAA